jgi:hypothetical protein
MEMPPRELMALRAAVEPMLMQASKALMQKETRTARRGMFQPGVTLLGVSQPLKGIGTTTSPVKER